jgi:hypothetical protein
MIHISQFHLKRTQWLLLVITFAAFDLWLIRSASQCTVSRRQM